MQVRFAETRGVVLRIQIPPLSSKRKLDCKVDLRMNWIPLVSYDI